MNKLEPPLQAQKLKTPLPVNLSQGEAEEKREDIRRYFHDTYDTYEALFEPLASNEAYLARQDPLRHPLVFYYGHTATFFVNKLVLGKFLRERLNPSFENMFAIGVDEMSWDDLDMTHYDWPHYEEVAEYRNQVRSAVDDLISSQPITLPVAWESPFWAILMGIEHERIHIETSSVLIRQLPLNLVKPHPLWPVCTQDREPPQNELLDVPGKNLVLGRKRESSLYGWDNEYGQKQFNVAAFKASKYLVSNQEFLEFVKDNGYSKEEYWTEEGWGWVNFQKTSHPRFWQRTETGDYKLRCMLETIDMPWSWPVETNQLEAAAFCRWKRAKTGQPIRLPTEDEWYRLLDHTETPDTLEWDKTPGNLNLERFASSEPVDEHEFGKGFFDILGNVWQHTETPISGFNGFKVHPLYDDFSTPTFDLKHNLIKGGSWASTGNEITRDSRYAFRRHFYQHAGFRYLESEADVKIPDDRYETGSDITPYCESNYGEEHLGVENYPAAIARLCLKQMTSRTTDNALVCGCKTGRSTFELATVFDHVTGIDLSARLIRIGVEMKDKGYTQYTLPSEGDIVTFHQRNLQDIGLDKTRGKVEFMQGDLSNLKTLYSGYDLILVDTVLERTNHPAKFLKEAHQRINPGGLLVIACTNDWNVKFTETKHWLGGYKDMGDNVTTLDSLSSLLSQHFTQIGDPVDIPIVQQKTSRTFDHNIAQLTVWELKN